MIHPLDLNLRHLRAAASVVEHGSVRAAAQAIGLSQPALTQGLTKLESATGLQLFARQSTGMSALPAAVALAARVERATAVLTEAFSHLSVRRLRSGAVMARATTATQLRALLAVAEAGSFVAAVDVAGVSQPALHRSIADLTHLAGCTLIERRGRGTVVTADGRRLVRGARLARAEIAAGLSEAGADRTDPVIRVGAMPLCRATLLPQAATTLLSHLPHIRLEIAEGSWRELVEPLRDGRLDLMIGALRDLCPPDLEQEELFVDRLAVIARFDHPLASLAAPDTDQLRAFPWIIGHDGSPLREHWKALFAGAPEPPAPVECGSVMTTRGILERSDCLTLLSPQQVTVELRAGRLTMIGPPLADHERRIGITTRAGWQRTQLQAALIAELRSASSAKLQ